MAAPSMNQSVTRHASTNSSSQQSHPYVDLRNNITAHRLQDEGNVESVFLDEGTSESDSDSTLTERTKGSSDASALFHNNNRKTNVHEHTYHHNRKSVNPSSLLYGGDRSANFGINTTAQIQRLHVQELQAFPSEAHNRRNSNQQFSENQNIDSSQDFQQNAKASNNHSHTRVPFLEMHNSTLHLNDASGSFQAPIQMTKEYQSTATSGSITQECPIPKKFLLEDWEGKDKPKRYFITTLIEPKGGKIEEKLKLCHASDQVVWNLVYVFNPNIRLPTKTPDLQLKTDALQFLISFRSQMIKLFSDEAKRNYFNYSLHDDWKELSVDGTGFSSYADLEFKTRNAVSEKVWNDNVGCT